MKDLSDTNRSANRVKQKEEVGIHTHPIPLHATRTASVSDAALDLDWPDGPSQEGFFGCVHHAGSRTAPLSPIAWSQHRVKRSTSLSDLPRARVVLGSAAKMRTLLSPPTCQTEMEMSLGPVVLRGVLFPSAVATSCRVTKFIRSLPACCFSCALAIFASSGHLISCPCSSSAQWRLHVAATISSSTSSTPLSSLMTLWGLSCPDFSFLVTAENTTHVVFCRCVICFGTRFSSHAVESRVIVLRTFLQEAFSRCFACTAHIGSTDEVHPGHQNTLLVCPFQGLSVFVQQVSNSACPDAHCLSLLTRPRFPWLGSWLLHTKTERDTLMHRAVRRAVHLIDQTTLSQGEQFRNAGRGAVLKPSVRFGVA